MDINSDDVMSNSRCVTGARTPGGQKTLFRLRVGMRGGGAIKTPTELSVSGLGRGPVATKKKGMMHMACMNPGKWNKQQTFRLRGNINAYHNVDLAL